MAQREISSRMDDRPGPAARVAWLQPSCTSVQRDRRRAPGPAKHSAGPRSNTDLTSSRTTDVHRPRFDVVGERLAPEPAVAVVLVLLDLLEEFHIALEIAILAPMGVADERLHHLVIEIALGLVGHAMGREKRPAQLLLEHARRNGLGIEHEVVATVEIPVVVNELLVRIN